MTALFTRVNEPTNEVKYKTLGREAPFSLSAKQCDSQQGYCQRSSTSLGHPTPLGGHSQQSEGRQEIWCTQSFLFLR